MKNLSKIWLLALSLGIFTLAWCGSNQNPEVVNQPVNEVINETENAPENEVTENDASETVEVNVEDLVENTDNEVDPSYTLRDLDEANTVQPENDEENILVVEDENMNTDYVINLKIWDKTLALPLEKNSATKALIEKLQEWDVIVNAREYWWFEKVGNLGFDLPREDKQITTEPGDLVLYQWNQISLFYESNSWSYTKLWKLGMISKDGLKEILWDWDVQLVFSLLD